MKELEAGAADVELDEILNRYWGFSGYRPLQREAMACVLAGRDSLVVLPTGGGKSLCYQAPALLLPGLAVVVSPLISLMKDQVDALNGAGVNAAFINSSLGMAEQKAVRRDLRAGRLKLLYVAPERLVKEAFLELLSSIRVSFFAVDEAHCISMWGHDFRPEYRALKRLRSAFPGVAVHAYTATATERVREDIRGELGLKDARILVGPFDRLNLILKVARRTQMMRQIRSVLDKHGSGSCIIYCIRRKDADGLASSLAGQGYCALPYHAGMTDGARKANQEAFLTDRAKIIVATVAFGMGIDKSNVRCVIHAGAPKSLEHYQQECGRAGRDGLEAECRLFFSGGDFITWRRFMDGMEPGPRTMAIRKLNDVYSYCTGLSCRHKNLVNYFGQSLERKSCEACDVCLGELDLAEEPMVTGQKILSCVVRLREGYGAQYTASVLCGSRDRRVIERGHDRLSTWGLLADEGLRNVRDWVEQLVDQEYLEKTGDFNVLRMTEKGWRVLKGLEAPRLLKPAKRSRPAKVSRASRTSWENVDRTLFEVLRGIRHRKALERGVPPYVVFGDAALRDMTRRFPTTRDAFLKVHGVGRKKCLDFGAEFLGAIRSYLENQNGREVDAGKETP